GFSPPYQKPLGQQDRNVPVGKVEMSPLISDRSLPFPLAPIVLLAAGPLQAPPRRAQRRRAPLTEPAASGTHFPDQEGMDPLEARPKGTFLLCSRGGHFYFAATPDQKPPCQAIYLHDRNGHWLGHLET